MQAGIDTAAAHDHVPLQGNLARERYCIEAVAQVQAASLGQGIGDEIVRHGDIMAAVNCHAVCQDGRDHRVMPNNDVMVREFLGPRSDTVVAIVAKEALLDDHTRDPAVQIESVRGGVQNTYMPDNQPVKGAIEPQSNLDVLNEYVADAAAAAERAADSGQGLVIVAFVDSPYDRQIVNVDRL